MSKKKQGGDIVHGDGLQMAERTATRQEHLLLVFESDCYRSSTIEVYRHQQNRRFQTIQIQLMNRNFSIRFNQFVKRKEKPNIVADIVKWYGSFSIYNTAHLFQRNKSDR